MTAVVTGSVCGESRSQKERASLGMIRIAVAYEEVDEALTSYEATVSEPDHGFGRSYGRDSDVVVADSVDVAAIEAWSSPSHVEAETDTMKA